MAKLLLYPIQIGNGKRLGLYRRFFNSYIKSLKLRNELLLIIKKLESYKNLLKNDMKVCMLVFGAIDYSVALTDALSKYCHIDFYCSKYHLKKGDSSILDVLKDKVQINCYGKYRIRDIRNISEYYKLCKDIENRQYDIIHFQEYGPPWLALFWRIRGKCPLVMTVHDPFQYPGIPFAQKVYQDIMQRIFIHRAKKIIVHGSLLKNQILERYYKKTNEDVVIIPHGDFTILKYWDKSGKNNKKVSPIKNILFFGNIRPNKGLEYLIKAENIIRNRLSDYRIIIAGKCDSFERYEKYIKPDARIEVINRYIPNKEVPRLFRDATVVVLPYISATQTGIIPLAYSFGKPVIATRVGAIPEIVEDGKTGFLIEPCNEKALATAIVSLVSDNNLLKEMSENALRYCKKNLSWDSIAKKTIKVYSEIISKQYEPIQRKV